MLGLGLVCLSHVIQGRNLCAGQKEERERDQKNGGMNGKWEEAEAVSGMCPGPGILALVHSQ